MTKNKKLWEDPWKYKESIIILSGIVCVGFMLQMVVGNFQFRLLEYPINIYCGIAILIMIVIFSYWSNSKFFTWISGIPFSVSVISFLMILTIIMGITPQINFSSSNNPHIKDWVSILGFNSMTSSWSFVLIYTITLISLGALNARRLINFKWKDYAFYLNHIGLFIILLFGSLGAADIKRYVMHVEEGKEEWRVYSKNGDVLELPIAIHLNDFIMEEYPPKLAIIDRRTGIVFPEEKPEYFQIDEKKSIGKLGEYKIQIEKYIHDAVKANDSTYNDIKMPGSCPAVYIVMTDKTGKELKGWISSGNTFQLYKVLNLTDETCVVMTQAEPKKFISDIVAYGKPKKENEEGKIIPFMLEVNKPLKIDDWTIYQYSYDSEAGKTSRYSSFELVYDPWVSCVYLGMIMLAIGCICLLWKTKKLKSN